MVLIVGPLFSGKREYAQKALGLREEDFSLRFPCPQPAVREAQELAGELGGPALEALADALALKKAVLCTEVGGGVVPTDPAQRARREAAGRLAQLLARRAQAVVRLWCGLPQLLKGDSMQILLLRHGQTAGNAQGRYIGVTDEPLSEAGCQALRPYDGPVSAPFVYTTPLRRTGQTAALVFPGLPQRPLPGLAEMDFGEFEGRSSLEMEACAPYRAWVEGGCQGPTPGGEDMASFSARCRAAFEGAVRDGLGKKLPQLIFVAHGGTLMALMSAYALPRRDFFDAMPQNGCGWRLALSGDAWAAQKGLFIEGEIRCGGPCP